MRAVRVDDVDAYLALVGPFLRAREAEHNLALGLLGRLRVEPRLYGFDPTFVVVEQAGEVVGCLLRTPPHGVVLSRFEDLAGVDAVAAEVIGVHPELPGAVGPTAEVARFAETWSRSTGVPALLAVRQRVHAAAAVHPVPRAPGQMRATRPDDVPTVLAWLRAFADEALGEIPHFEDVEVGYRRREADPDGAWLVWDDDGLVSLAAFGSPTPSGTRVGPVYTPPEHRRHGYGAAVTAAASRWALDVGARLVVLFTDAGNPSTNALYPRLGYRYQHDAVMLEFACPG